MHEGRRIREQNVFLHDVRSQSMIEYDVLLSTTTGDPLAEISKFYRYQLRPSRLAAGNAIYHSCQVTARSYYRLGMDRQRITSFTSGHSYQASLPTMRRK